MKTALPNWICAVCMIIITLWVIEKRIQEVQLGRSMERIMQTDPGYEKFKQDWERTEREVEQNVGKNPGLQPPPLPQMQTPKHSSEWGKGR